MFKSNIWTKRIKQQAFVPQENPNNPYDVSLVVEDGRRKFKAHRRVLSEASPFFEKLFNSDMRETKQGVVRLEMLTELCLGKILEFIYTGNVQISTEDDAQEMIVAADYLVLPHLKTLAGRVLEQNLESSNAILTYQLAERFRCEQLIFSTKMFIYSNITDVAETEEFLNLSSEEVQMWISSDELNVSAEEDVFKIILTWIYRAKRKREKYFHQLFREVRLVYVSLDFLQNDIVKNDLVNGNKGCMDLVKDALMKLTDSEILDFYTLNTKPRKSLETSVIVTVFYGIKINPNLPQYNQSILVCYFPQEEKWSAFTLPREQLTSVWEMASACRGKLYFYPFLSHERRLVYDSFSHCWKACAFPPGREKESSQRALVFLKNEEIFALSDWDTPTAHISVEKYKPESDSWEHVTRFLDLGPDPRFDICIVAKDNYIYFLGGHCERFHYSELPKFIPLADCDRYDLTTNTWDKIADLQEPRADALGAAAYGKVFVIGGDYSFLPSANSCEVYDETTNEWHFIASCKPRRFRGVVCADDKMFLVSGYDNWDFRKEPEIIECYDPDEDEWKEKTQIPLEWMRVNFEFPGCRFGGCCSMRVFKGSKLFQSRFPQHEGDHLSLLQSVRLPGQSTSSDNRLKSQSAHLPGQSTSSHNRIIFRDNQRQVTISSSLNRLIFRDNQRQVTKFVNVNALSCDLVTYN